MSFGGWLVFSGEDQKYHLSGLKRKLPALKKQGTKVPST